MKQLGTLKPGTIFTFAKKQFVVLEGMDDGVFCLLAQSDKSVPFHNGDDYPLGDYRKASLREYIEGTWLKDLKDGMQTSDEEKAMLPFNVDLRPTDQSEGYGTLEGVLAAPLTLWQYGKYKDIIPFNEDDGWWLVTPWACPWLRSPNTYYTDYAWLVYSSGDCYNNNCSGSYGVRPALKLASYLLVSVEGEEDEEATSDGCDNPTVDLSGVDTMTLIREVERRISVLFGGGGTGLADELREKCGEQGT